jgi:dTDP-L-rhamnose 4-epimerase
MKALVIGGAGFIGSHLVDALVAIGHEVTVFDSLEPQVHGDERRPPAYLNRAAKFVEADVRDRRAVEESVLAADVVFFKAAAVGVGQSMHEVRRYVEVNSLGAANVADVLANARHHIRKVVVASSMSIYGEGTYRCGAHGVVHPRPRTEVTTGWSPVCPRAGCREQLEAIPTHEDTALQPTSVYGITKRDHEELMLCVGAAYGIPTVALRYFNVYGTRQALSNPYTGVAAIFCSRLINGQSPLVYEDGEQQRDFVHVSDVVRANVLALERDGADGEAVNIGSGQPVSILDVARCLTSELGVALGAEVTSKFRTGDVRHCFADITKARTLLGFEPRVSFEAGARELIAWVRGERSEDHHNRARTELESRRLVR